MRIWRVIREDDYYFSLFLTVAQLTTRHSLGIIKKPGQPICRMKDADKKLHAADGRRGYSRRLSTAAFLEDDV